jgi:hypothetical protein
MPVHPSPPATLPGAAWLLDVGRRQTSPDPEHHPRRPGSLPFDTDTVRERWLDRRVELTASAWRVGRGHNLQLVEAGAHQTLAAAQVSLGRRRTALRYCLPSNGGNR